MLYDVSQVFREAMSPAPKACVSAFPAAVASVGPATTSLPVMLAASWFSSRFCEPPPTGYG